MQITLWNALEWLFYIVLMVFFVVLLAAIASLADWIVEAWRERHGKQRRRIWNDMRRREQEHDRETEQDRDREQAQRDADLRRHLRQPEE